MNIPGMFAGRHSIGGGCVLASAVLAWSLAISPAQASNNDRKDTQADQAEQKDQSAKRASSNDQAERGERGERKPTDLESCRRDADGKKGPDRSRFMTACLKERP